jgi:hypothetical protein
LPDDTCALLAAELRDDLPNALDSNLELLLDELRWQPQYGETETTKVTFAALVSRTLPSVNEAIHFHDEAKLSGTEICDVAWTNRHLATELDSEGTAANCCPQDLLGPRRERAEFRCAFRDELLATRGCTRLKR